MKRLIAKIFLVILGLALTACSSRYIEGDPGISEDELIDRLQNISISSGGSVNGSMSLFSYLIDQPDTIFYYAEAPSALGPTQSIFSFVDFGPFDPRNPETSPYDIESGSVAFLDGFDENGEHRYVLALNYELIDGGSVSLVTADDGYAFNEDVFEAIFPSHDGDILVRTYNLQSDVNDFTAFIELKVYRLTPSGEQYIGKISTLAGFGS